MSFWRDLLGKAKRATRGAGPPPSLIAELAGERSYADQVRQKRRSKVRRARKTARKLVQLSRRKNRKTQRRKK